MAHDGKPVRLNTACVAALHPLLDLHAQLANVEVERRLIELKIGMIDHLALIKEHHPEIGQREICVHISQGAFYFMDEDDTIKKRDSPDWVKELLKTLGADGQ